MSYAARNGEQSGDTVWCRGAAEFSQTEFASAKVKGAFWYSTPNRFALRIPGIAACSVSGGGPVHLQSPNIDDAIDARFVVQGLPLAARFVQQSLLVVHASAVLTPRGAIVIAGHSGAGKSTLIAALALRGYPILAEQVTPIEVLSVAGPRVLPGMTDLLLWRDAADRLSINISSAVAVRKSLERYYIAGLPTTSTSQPLHSIYLLGLRNKRQVSLELLRGQQRVMAPMKLVFNRHLAEPPDARKKIFGRLGIALSTVRTQKLSRPDGIWSLDEMVALIEKDLAS